MKFFVCECKLHLENRLVSEIFFIQPAFISTIDLSGGSAPERPGSSRSIYETSVQHTLTFQVRIDLKGKNPEIQYHTSHFNRFRKKNFYENSHFYQYSLR